MIADDVFLILPFPERLHADTETIELGKWHVEKLWSVVGRQWPVNFGIAAIQV